MTTDLHRLVKKLWRCSKYPSLNVQKVNHKKWNVCAMRVVQCIFHSHIHSIHCLCGARSHDCNMMQQS